MSDEQRSSRLDHGVSPSRPPHLSARIARKRRSRLRHPQHPHKHAPAPEAGQVVEARQRREE